MRERERERERKETKKKRLGEDMGFQPRTDDTV